MDDDSSQPDEEETTTPEKKESLAVPPELTDSGTPPPEKSESGINLGDITESIFAIPVPPHNSEATRASVQGPATTKVSVSFSTEVDTGSSAFSIVNDGNISKSASKTVDKAIHNAVEEIAETCLFEPDKHDDNVACTNSQTTQGPDIQSSTQVLVSVVQFPEESLAQVPGRRSVVEKHLFPVESVFDEGIRIHRNMGEQDIDHPSQLGLTEEGETGGVDVGRSEAKQTSLGPGGIGGALMDGLQGDSYSLVDEIAVAVAATKFEGSGAAQNIFQEIYSKFKDIAKVFTNPGYGDSPRSSIPRGHHTDNAKRTIPSSQRAGSSGSGGGGAQRKLPPEVKDRVMRTLSDVKTQLDSIKDQLLKGKEGAPK